jgi:thiol-disulfide isomerase/thioredoxin
MKRLIPGLLALVLFGCSPMTGYTCNPWILPCKTRIPARPGPSSRTDERYLAECRRSPAPGRPARQSGHLEMWTFGCINCQNVMPSLKEWHSKYKDEGLVIIGNHYPEFSYEEDLENLKDAIARYRDRICGCTGQRRRHLAGVSEPLLARAVPDRQAGPHPLCAYRRRTIQETEENIKALLAETY